MRVMQDTELLARAQAKLDKEGDVRGAVQIYQKLLKRRPNDPSLLERIGTGLIRLGQLDEARKHLSKATKLRPTPHAFRNLARTYEYQGRVDEALRTLEGGLKRAPGDPVLLACKSDVLFLKGDLEEAWRVVEPLVGPDADPSVLFSMARVSARVGKAEEAIDALRAALDDGRVPDWSRAQAHFQLASLLDGLGEHDRAFEEAETANRLRALAFDAERFLEDVERLIRAWTPEAARGVARSADASEIPVFIVGMPRSGTSLVEQIVASHPRAFGAGERTTVGELARELPSSSREGLHLVDRPEALTQPVATRLGRRLIATMRAHHRGASRVTDKLPRNSFHLGFLSSIAPGGRAIHCVRHPMDSCTSCFFQAFPDSVSFAGDLEHLAAYYAGYWRVMQHWKEVLEYPILDVVYEELVQDFEPIAQGLIDFVGLEWDDACARFHETKRVTATASVDQVRQPLYRTSAARWKRYGSRLDPLREALRRYGVEFDE